MLQLWKVLPFALLAFSSHTEDTSFENDIGISSDPLSSVEFLFFNFKEEPHAVKHAIALNPEDYDPLRNTIIIIHGFGDYYPGSFLIPALVEAYSSRGSQNIIAVEWGELAAAPYYFSAARNTYPVGQKLAEFLEEMMSIKNHSMRNTEMVGFSLGAHVAGVASYHLLEKPRRIIGLDPAQLLFAKSPKEFILDESDAPLVEVVHSAGGHFAFLKPVGHRDFYPNGGAHPQPGCEEDVTGICSHRRSYQYFAEAIKNKGRGFKATQCISMEDYLDRKCNCAPKLLLANKNYNPDLRGSFYFTTNAQKPFGKKQ